MHTVSVDRALAEARDIQERGVIGVYPLSVVALANEVEAMRKDAALGRFVRQRLTECHGGWAIAQTFIPDVPSLEDVTDVLPLSGDA